LKLLLCDTVIIIDAHSLELWNTLKSHYRIHIVSSVLAKESQHFIDGLQMKHYLDFNADIAQGRVVKISASMEDIQKVMKRTRESRCEIHLGEAESIAALLQPENQQLCFCTADKTAVAAAHLFDVMARVKSFEECLRGLKSCTLPYKLTDKAMQKWRAEAIRRFGLDAVGMK